MLMIQFDFRDPLSWTGFALGVVLSLTVFALASPEPVGSHNNPPCHATSR